MITIRNLIFSILFLFSFQFNLVSSTPAKADDMVKNSTKCLQNQLNALGIDVGAADGLLGKKLSQGMQKLSKIEAFAKVPTERTIFNAIPACKHLGEIKPELSKYWATNTKDYKIQYGPLIPPIYAKLVKLAVDQFQNKLKKYGSQLSVIPRINVFIDEKAGKSFYLNSQKVFPREGNEQEFDHRFGFQCKLTDISGWVTTDILSVCFVLGQNNQLLDEFERTTAKTTQEAVRVISTVVHHELFHLAQNELIGLFGFQEKPKDIKQAILEARGPNWLHEGMATYFEDRHLLSNLPEEEYYKKLDQSLSIKAFQLSTIEIFPDERNSMADAYERGQHAVYFLQKITSKKALVNFYRQIGLGMSWKDAFKEAFHMSIEEFYQKYGEI